jgi:hypothetical protein
VRVEGDEMAADADDGDAGHFSGTYMTLLELGPVGYRRRTMHQRGTPSGWAWAILVGSLLLPSCRDGGGIDDLDEPPPVTVRSGDRSLELTAWAYCFEDVCASGFPPAAPPHIGDPEKVVVEFNPPEWSFIATFVPADGKCRPAQRLRLASTPDGRFVLTPVGDADTYDVTLFGKGDGDLAVTFRWTTPRDGPPGDLRSVTLPCTSS